MRLDGVKVPCFSQQGSFWIACCLKTWGADSFLLNRSFCRRNQNKLSKGLFPFVEGSKTNLGEFSLTKAYQLPLNSSISGIIDSSGIRISITKSLRPNDVGLLYIGQEVKWQQVVPPFQKNFLSTGYCSENCITKVILLGPQVTSETYLRTCAPSEDTDQPAHSRNLIRIFTTRIFDSQRCKISSCRQRREMRRTWVCCSHHYENNILRILAPKNENFQVKILILFIFLLKKIDYGYSLELSCQGGSTEYPILCLQQKNNLYPCKAQFYYIKVGFNGANI